MLVAAGPVSFGGILGQVAGMLTAWMQQGFLLRLHMLSTNSRSLFWICVISGRADGFEGFPPFLRCAFAHCTMDSVQNNCLATVPSFTHAVQCRERPFGKCSRLDAIASWRPLLPGWSPLLLRRKPFLFGWRPSLVG